jgi:hypothetical protein
MKTTAMIGSSAAGTRGGVARSSDELSDMVDSRDIDGLAKYRLLPNGFSRDRAAPVEFLRKSDAL